MIIWAKRWSTCVPTVVIYSPGSKPCSSDQLTKDRLAFIPVRSVRKPIERMVNFSLLIKMMSKILVYILVQLFHLDPTCLITKIVDRSRKFFSVFFDGKLEYELKIHKKIWMVLCRLSMTHAVGVIFSLILKSQNVFLWKENIFTEFPVIALLSKFE